MRNEGYLEKIIGLYGKRIAPNSPEGGLDSRHHELQPGNPSTGEYIRQELKSGGGTEVSYELLVVLEVSFVE